MRNKAFTGDRDCGMALLWQTQLCLLYHCTTSRRCIAKLACRTVMHHAFSAQPGHPSQASANNPAPDFLSISGNPCNHSIQLPKSSTLIFFPRRNAPMRPSKFVLASSVLLLSATLLCGQKLSAQNSPASPSSTVPSLRVNAREVVVDVNVTDAKGNPVHGLTQDNFTVLEDGRPMVPRSFREHRSDQKPAESPAAARPSLRQTHSPTPLRQSQRLPALSTSCCSIRSTRPSRPSPSCRSAWLTCGQGACRNARRRVQLVANRETVLGPGIHHGPATAEECHQEQEAQPGSSVP